MKKEHYTAILEFECIAPTCDGEAVGDLYALNEDGRFISSNSKIQRDVALLFLLDHPDHYRVSKIAMDGNKYIIPQDREKNWYPKTHPDLMKYCIT